MDREQRLDDVTRAAWRVLARDGLGALSVRNVAAEAGLPASSLRYVLPTQSALREHAIEASVQQFEARLSAIDRTRPDWPRRVLLELVPLDDERRLEMEVFIALGVAALTDPSLQPARERWATSLRNACTTAITELRRGERYGDDGPSEIETLSVLTHAVVDGLALQIVQQGAAADATWAESALEAFIKLAITTAR